MTRFLTKTLHRLIAVAVCAGGGVLLAIVAFAVTFWTVEPILRIPQIFWHILHTPAFRLTALLSVIICGLSSLPDPAEKPLAGQGQHKAPTPTTPPPPRR